MKVSTQSVKKDVEYHKRGFSFIAKSIGQVSLYTDTNNNESIEVDWFIIESVDMKDIKSGVKVNCNINDMGDLLSNAIMEKVQEDFIDMFDYKVEKKQESQKEEDLL